MQFSFPNSSEFCCFALVQKSLVYDFLLSKELGNQVKVRLTTLFIHFLMTQYDDSKWIEHSRVT